MGDEMCRAVQDHSISFDGSCVNTQDDAETALQHFEEDGDVNRLEVTLLRLFQLERLPTASVLNDIIAIACKRNETSLADRLLKKMLDVQHRPPQEAFDFIIEAYAGNGDAMKVEEWLLAAGNQGWTPRSEAF